MSLFGQKIESNVFLLVLLNLWVNILFSSCDDLNNMLKLVGVCVLIALVNHFIINQRQKHFRSKNYKACYALAI